MTRDQIVCKLCKQEVDHGDDPLVWHLYWEHSGQLVTELFRSLSRPEKTRILSTYYGYIEIEDDEEKNGK